MIIQCYILVIHLNTMTSTSKSHQAAASSTQNSQGIQILLEAEREADKIVQNGKSYRVQRLKDAKLEAAKEVEALKLSKMNELSEREKQHAASLEQIISQDKEHTQKRIEESTLLFEKSRERVANMLLQAVSNAQPNIHPNIVRK